MSQRFKVLPSLCKTSCFSDAYAACESIVVNYDLTMIMHTSATTVSTSPVHMPDAKIQIKIIMIG
jgi:hypothetical protein